MVWVFFYIKRTIFSIDYEKKVMMEWKNLRQGKGQNFQRFTEEFRKQALALNTCRLTRNFDEINW